jgi:hypothetical protein
VLTHDEKRDYIRMEVDCDMTYKLADSDVIRTGRCITLSGAGMAFITDHCFDLGLAMEVNILPKTTITPPMTAFIEVVRVDKIQDGQYQIAATIKSIKGN